jgi:hypothetical protein
MIVLSKLVKKLFVQITKIYYPLIYLIVGFGSLVKVIYAWTREIFPSGPDANGFIPSAENFWKYGFFSDSVDVPTIYSAGYPYFLSFIVGIFDNDWYKGAQLIQILIFGIGTLFFAKSLVRMHFRSSSLLFVVLVSFHPAWITATSMAMYETLLFFLLSLTVYTMSNALLLNTVASSINSALSLGLIFGLLALVHPRGLLFCLPFLLTTAFIVQKKNLFFTIFLSIFSPIAWATMYRSSRDSGIFNLGGNVWASSTWGRKPIDACLSLECTLESWLNKPLENIGYSLENAWKFLTPYSGPLVKGTWFHNISAQYYLAKSGFLTFSITVSYILMISGLLYFSYAVLRLYTALPYTERSMKIFTQTIFSSVVLMLLTGALTYGDSRHRLLAIPLIYVIIISSHMKFKNLAHKKQ